MTKPAADPFAVRADPFAVRAEPHARGGRSRSEIVVVREDNRLMTDPASQPGGVGVRDVLRAPFTRRAWVDLGYAILNVPVAIAGFVVLMTTSWHPMLLFVSTPVARGLGTANRELANQVLGEQVPAPAPMRPKQHVYVRTPDAGRLATLVAAEGGKVKLRLNRLDITGLPASRVAELADKERMPIGELKTQSAWLEAAIRDRPGWRARGYVLLKLPVSLLGLAAVGLTWFGGLAGLAAPIWWHANHPQGSRHLALIVLLMLLGAVALLAAPWLTNAAVAADRSLIRGLLGPSAMAERVRSLEQSRAHAVDDSAARLRSIERDLHDGAQAQLVGLAMKLGLAKERLGGGTASGAGGGLTAADLDRAVELVDAAHRGAIEAITELRVLARGIHPPVLDNGLADALGTLAARSAVPVELIADIGERPSAAIETIAYFCAAELLANVAKHSGARHATLEAVHVPGLLRIRVTDDGHGGARLDAGGGLGGLADRIRTVDGRMEISSPRGGPTVVTVELPSHA
jgi:signal transduction histidine kinase